MTDIEVPEFFDPANGANRSFSPALPEIMGHAKEYVASHNIQKAQADKIRIELLLIDCQKDFCFPSAFIPEEREVSEKTVRIVEFIYRNLPHISYITTMMRSHFPYQIFLPLWWMDKCGRNVEAATVITSEDVWSEKYKPSPEVSQFAGGTYNWVCKQSEYYAKSIESMGHQLHIKPFHCLMGSDGWNLAGVIQEACWFHAVTRGIQPGLQLYDTNPWTECYSIFGPDCLTRWDGKGALDQRNTALFQKLRHNDFLVFAGGSTFHSIIPTVDDLINEIFSTDPMLARKVYLLKDCIGYGEEEKGKICEKYETAGINVVKSAVFIEMCNKK
ncbi:hypothetical protein [Terasakiella sp. SH-1]|uniref:hypothetical protein n=1 Tax=Terasakiella sp. SH-1 TaxID=2560057 RepID=UPI0010738D5F|nr:hypothetical protein [Terasakiella sp. SH-1]